MKVKHPINSRVMRLLEFYIMQPVIPHLVLSPQTFLYEIKVEDGLVKEQNLISLN